MAQLITVTAWNKLTPTPDSYNKTATSLVLNVRNILAVKTRTTAYQTTGVTDILYEFPVNEARYQVNLIVTEALSAIVTAANAVPAA